MFFFYSVLLILFFFKNEKEYLANEGTKEGENGWKREGRLTRGNNRERVLRTGLGAVGVANKCAPNLWNALEWSVCLDFLFAGLGSERKTEIFFNQVIFLLQPNIVHSR